MNHYGKKNPSINQAEEKLKDFKIGIILFSLSFVAILIFGLDISRTLINLLKAQAPDTVQFIQFSPIEIFFNSLEIAILFSLFLSLPFALYNYFLHKYPQINKDNKKLLIYTLIAGFFLFLLGIMTAYFVFIPTSLYILLGYSSGIATLNVDISSYVSYCLNFIIVVGIIFQFPIYFIILKKTRFINYKVLTKNRKKILIGILITAFVLTFSTALFTFAFLAATILVLYLLIIFMAKIFTRQEF